MSVLLQVESRTREQKRVRERERALLSVQLDCRASSLFVACCPASEWICALGDRGAGDTNESGSTVVSFCGLNDDGVLSR